MRFYYANQPAAIIIGLLSVAVIVALAAVFLPLIFGLLLLAVGAAALFWAWGWLKVKMGWAKPEAYADWREVMRRAEEQARAQYGERRGGAESVYIETDVTVETDGEGNVRRETSTRRRWKMTDVEDAETK